jgi:hypothetical protein
MDDTYPGTVQALDALMDDAAYAAVFSVTLREEARRLCAEAERLMAEARELRKRRAQPTWLRSKPAENLRFRRWVRDV